MASTSPDVMDKLVSLCQRHGFIFQSSEIYGGTGSVWDYGPLGVELKRNIKDRWWQAPAIPGSNYRSPSIQIGCGRVYADFALN